jgi:hypothetical protein
MIQNVQQHHRLYQWADTLLGPVLPSSGDEAEVEKGRDSTLHRVIVNGTASSIINLGSQVHHATQQNIGNVGGDFGNACGEAYLPPNGDHIARVRGLRALRRYRLETRRLECLAGKLLRYFSRTPLFDDRFCDGTYLLARRDSPQTL